MIEVAVEWNGQWLKTHIVATAVQLVREDDFDPEPLVETNGAETCWVHLVSGESYRVHATMDEIQRQVALANSMR